MYFQLLQIIFVCVVVCISQALAGGIIAPTFTTQDQNIYRSFGNLAQVSTHSKTIDTPFSSVSKSDVRISNPGLLTSYAGPALAHTYAAPAITHSAYPAPAFAHATYGAAAPAFAHTTYTAPAPVVAHAAPALAHTYAGPAFAHSYATPAVAHTYAAPAAVTKVAAAPAGSLIGVAYSAAPAVAHMSYSNGLGVSYSW